MHSETFINGRCFPEPLRSSDNRHALFPSCESFRQVCTLKLNQAIHAINLKSNCFMRKTLLTFFLSLLTGSLFAQFDSAPAFPGAEGHGRYTVGGRGGAVYHVTSLADDGSEGTFRWACNKAGKRTIVFDVSGTIYLKSELKLRNGYVSILGQTAPGDGICIADYPFSISASNVVIRYMRFRLGNRNVAYHEGDGLGGIDQANIVVDHCSVSWSVDECLSVYGSKNISVQWCIADQSMVDCGHSKGKHGYGGNWGGSGASYHHNLIAHHTSRTPRLGPRPGTQTDERMDLRNNVIYNWGGNGCYGGEGMNVNIVNNYYKPGPGSPTGTKGMRIAAIGIRTSEYTKHDTDSPNEWDKMWHVWGKYYVDGNVNSLYDEVTKDNWEYGMYNQINNSSVDNTFTQETRDTMRIYKPITYGSIVTHNAAAAYDKVLAHAGASFRRDSHDMYIVNDVTTATAKYTGAGNSPGFINSQDDAGGWPDLASAEAPLDTDRDGMPDEWEKAHGLNPENADDRNAYNLDSRRFYTNLEVYCNSLVEEQMKAQREGAMSDVEGYFEEYYPDMQNGGGGEIPPAGETTQYNCPGTLGNSVTFGDGATLTITGNASKEITAGSDITVEGEKRKSMKVSNGAQNTFVAPSGKHVSKVTFYSYINKASDATERTSFWAEIDGTTYTAETASIMKSFKDGEHPDVATFTIGGKSQFTFTNSGDQVCYVMDIEYGSSSGITTITATPSGAGKMYNIQGQQVDGSHKGIVILDGKKYIK